MRRSWTSSSPGISPRCSRSPTNCALSPADEAAALGEAGRELSEHLRRLRGGSPVRAAAGTARGTSDLTNLHRRAHALAGRALVVAASRADTGAAILAARRMEAHAAAIDPTGSAQPTTTAGSARPTALAA